MAKISSVAVVAAALAASAFIVVAAGSSDREKLYDALFADYNRDVIPIPEDEPGVRVGFGLAAINMAMETDGTLAARMWYRYVYHDYRLRFDPAKFNNISVLRVDASKVWVPDITLYNE